MAKLGGAATARSLWVGLALVFGASTLQAQEVEITEKARTHFRAGVNYMQDPDGARYEEAYREFRAAYAEAASWKILGNLGIAAMKLERDGEAIEAFKKYLSEGGDQVAPDERKQFERDLQTLEASVVTIKVVSQPPGAVFIDERIPVRGEPVVNRYEPAEQWVTAAIRPGHHRVTAKLAGYEDTKWEFEARPAESYEHVFEMKKPEPVAAQQGGPLAGTGATQQTARPVPTGVYIGLAATGVLAVGAGVVGVLALGKKSEFDDANDGTNQEKAQDLRDSGEQLNRIADILGLGAVAAGIVTTVLFVTRPEVPVDQDSAALVLRPVAGPSGGGLSVSGAF